jgi:hypothetical protein
MLGNKFTKNEQLILDILISVYFLINILDFIFYVIIYLYIFYIWFDYLFGNIIEYWYFILNLIIRFIHKMEGETKGNV